MDKLVAIRIYDGQNYSDEIPVNVLAENVQWNESSTLIDILGSINLTRKGNIQDQIDELNNRINNVHGDVVSVNGKTGTVILTAADLGAGIGNYNKPISGIPKTDLANSVQISLEKADTALQSYTETDPTVPAWAKQPNKPTYTAQEVGALPADSQITVEVDDTLSVQGAAADAKAVGDALASNTNVSRIIASTYSDSNTYNVGSLVLYNGLLWRCKTKITTSEPWTRNHWDLLTIEKSLTPLELGFLWTTCNTAENNLNKIISLFSYDDIQYNPKNFGIIAVYFYNAVLANSTLNVNDTGAKPIYKGTSPIGDDEIKAGDTAYFMLNGIGHFEFLGVDSYGIQIKTIKQDLEIEQARAETTQALKINKPVTNPNGTQGQILQTDGQGGTSWVDGIADEQIADAVTDWLDDHVTPGGSTIVVDNTLSIQGAAADAKKTGDEIRQHLGLTDDIKQALLQIAEKVAYIDEDGQDYYDALESALYPSAEIVSISAVYTQSGTVYNNDSLDSLKPDLVVTAYKSDSTTQTITAYTLSGTLTEGTSTITVSYGGKSSTFTVSVETPTWRYSASDGTLLSEQSYLDSVTVDQLCTEELIDGELRLTAPQGSTEPAIRYYLTPTTNTHAAVRFKIRYISIPAANGGASFRIVLSDGSKGSRIGVHKLKNGTAYKLTARAGTTDTDIAEISLNTWYEILLVKNGSNTTVTLDGLEIYNSDSPSTSYTAANQIFNQSVNDSTTVDSIVDVDYIEYYNYDIVG